MICEQCGQTLDLDDAVWFDRVVDGWLVLAVMYWCPFCLAYRYERKPIKQQPIFPLKTLVSQPKQEATIK